MRDGEHGVVTLEAVAGVAVVLVVAVLLLHVLAFGRDVLVVHEAARAGARAAAATAGEADAVRAAREVAEGLPVHVRVTPAGRREGDLVTVEVTVRRSVGPLSPQVRARAVSRVEPGVGAG